MNKGIVLAFSAYIFWGVHPVYWKLLQKVPAYEIVSNRIFFSFLFFVIILCFRKRWPELIAKIRDCRKKWTLILPAFLIGTNWLTYIWAVNANYIIETSLGYFICPLLSVFLGVYILKERLRNLQWLAVSIAGIGVLVMTIIYGQFPWISLYLAGSWALYGLIRKKSPLGPVEGLALETAVLSIGAIIYFFYLGFTDQSLFFSAWPVTTLLIGTGLISGAPLIVFIAASRLIKFSLIGIIQYIYPTMIFLIGWIIYDEPLNEAKLTGFAFIWIALVIYSVEGLIYLGRRNKSPAGGKQA
ncbi:MAG: EamA family transporter RarD [Calditrichaceae bacterium]|nr:EamA family transporter RarD [Calditrichaceae bacterium]MBN2708633.1 EamA family transporter RarD [Calditrichaceae bacterium]RQV95482.1 MAG: EamA family transporter RarD [Calditrichota bacterium]